MRNLLLLPFIFLSTFCYAEIVEYTFTDTNNNSVSKKSDVQFINPSSELSVFLSGGLDRKIKLSITDLSTNTNIYEHTSNYITIDDRLQSSEGLEYYAKIFSVPRLSDGNYRFTHQLIDNTNSIVVTETKDVTIDTELPSFGEWSAQGGYGMDVSSETFKLGRGGSGNNRFFLNDVNDNTEIDKAMLVLYREDGREYSRRNAIYDPVNSQLTNNYRYLFPLSNLDETFTVKYEISDIAGNVSHLSSKKMMMDNDSGERTLVGFYNPSESGSVVPGLSNYEAYRSGMTVYTNPVRFVYRIPKTNWHEYSEGGLRAVNGAGSVSKVSEDDNNVYVQFIAPYNFFDGNYIRFVNKYEWGGAGVGYSVTLDPSAKASPYLAGVDYYYSDVGWTSMYRYAIQNDQLPVSISKVRIRVSSRNYDQIGHHIGGSCTIPAGSTSCEYPWSYTMESGETGYLHSNATAYDTDYTLRSNPRWAEVQFNDKHYPSIDAVYDDVEKSITANINQPGAGYYFDRLRLSHAWLVNADNEQQINASGGFVSRNGQNYVYKWYLKDIPEGDYQIRVRAKERHGPKTDSTTFAYRSDSTPPVINFAFKDQPYIEGMIIKGLENISFKIENASSVAITSINFKGGPASDNVELAWNHKDDSWGLEYPRTFPSQDDADMYILTVTATDAFSQSTTDVYKFKYEPNNLFSVESVKTLAVSRVLRDSTNKPHILIKSNQLRSDNGNLAFGPQQVFVTVRSDSPMPLKVHDSVIRPGETKGIDVDIGSDGRLYLPLIPAESGIEGKAQYMLEINGIN